MRALGYLLIGLLVACGGGGPVSIAQAQLQAQVELAHLHCILRPDASGHWYIQDNADHASYGFSPTVEQTDTYIRLFFTRNYRYAGTVQVTSDDDFRSKVQGFSNLGLGSITIKVEADGQLIDPADVLAYVPFGGGNLWVNVTMVNK